MKKQKLKKMKRQLPLYLMALPGILYLLINNYLPMTGLVVAFKEFNYRDGIWGSPWNGVNNFKYLFSTSTSLIITRNTLLYNLAFIVLNTLVALTIAILLNEIRKGIHIKFFQTVILLPYLLSIIIVGYLVSIPFGMVDFSSIGEAGVCQLPSLMHFGVQFEPSSCVALGILFAINSIQAIGDYSATTIGAMDRTPKDDELQRGIVGYGLSNVVGALLGGLPTATYSQNVGIVTTTKVINRWVLGLAAAILGIAGMVPKFSAILTTIPQCVLGGATVSVFASIAMTGMKLVASAEMDYRNSSIVGLAAALGMGVSQATAALASFPTWVTTIFGKSPVVLATIIAVMLNVILPKTRDEQKEEAKKKIKIEQKLEEDHREFGE